ncbi:MAG TPA: hypothetical protein DD671_06805, partial [Balneolaceae bacterium]|nr:hypothetical protein [Balneolaceae bacterium]
IVVEEKTGETKIEKKFYKTDFGEVWQDDQYKPYVNAVFCAAYADIVGDSFKSADISADSYEEMRQISMDLGDDFVDPE